MAGSLDFTLLDRVGAEQSFMKPRAAAARSRECVEPPHAATDEDTLLARSREGDTRAYRALVELHQDRVYGLALRILRSPADAEEVAQDAFVRAWLALRDFRGESTFSTWIHRIAARRALDRAATLKARRARESTWEHAAETVPADAPSTSRAGSRRIEALLEALSPPQRAVIACFYFEDLAIPEIARTLAMPEGTVKTHLSRGRAALRAEWTRRRRLEITHELS
jgi:RNA polymerase sigma-70 factor, ECF subfamily